MNGTRVDRFRVVGAEVDSAAQGSLHGVWQWAVIVVEGGPGRRATSRVYGCPRSVHQVMSDRLAQAYEEFANLYGLAGRDWKYATHAIVVDRGPPFRETHRVTDLAPDRGWDFGDALRTLDRTAMARWRAGLGPGEFPAAAADELLVPHAGDLPLPADALAVVARECGRRADSRFSHFVANLTWDRPDHVGVQLHGMLLRAGDWRFACRSGRAQLAACRLASAAADLGPPRALYVLIAREPSGGLRFRATRDGEAAVRLLHVTEHARLRSLRKLPRGL